jgi:hypothetical protein
MSLWTALYFKAAFAFAAAAFVFLGLFAIFSALYGTI